MPEARTKILFVDDEKAIRHLFRTFLEDSPFQIETASDGEEALKKLGSFAPDIVISDVRMPKMDGLELLSEIHSRYPDIFVIIVTGDGTIEDGVKAIKSGAYDYILKPFDFAVVRLMINNIAAQIKKNEENIYSGHELRKHDRFENIAGRDPKMIRVFQKTTDIAGSKAAVLITGETGTGKELVADAIHYKSSRRNGPFIKVNCAALPETLIASELFGHEKGAFTGALSQKKGHFELAHGGTIFLDEIGDIPIPTQIALLRVIDLGSFQRLGGSVTIEVDTRLVCATNKKLTDAVAEGHFREDLFYRINVAHVHIPALRERKSDIPLLANHFLRKFCKEEKKLIQSISKDAMKILIRYDWPGNVRELKNVMERAVIFCKGREILKGHFPESLNEKNPSEKVTLQLPSRSLATAESTLIRQVLEETDWNLKQASRVLDIARGTLYSKMKKFGIERQK